MTEKEAHDVSLRVMRLARPNFNCIPPTSLVRSGNNSISDFAYSQFLALPAHFGDIHVGETFCCFISINNHSSDRVYYVSLKCELQSNSKRLLLIDTGKEPTEDFPEGKSLDFIVRQRIEEVGTYILICHCTYTRTNRETKTFKKFFKFPVTMPFQLTTKIVPMPSGIILQAIIFNGGAKPLNIDKIQFLTENPNFTIRDITPKSKFSFDIPGVSVIDDIAYLSPGDLKSFLFQLEYISLRDAFTQKIKNTGNWKISWRVAFGDSGEMSFEQIQIPTISRSPLNIFVSGIPEEIYAETPFEITFNIINNNELPMNPKMSFLLDKIEKTVLPLGRSIFTLPTIPPFSQLSHTVSFLPLKLGLHYLPSILIEDISPTTLTAILTQEIKNPLAIYVSEPKKTKSNVESKLDDSSVGLNGNDEADLSNSLENISLNFDNANVINEATQINNDSTINNNNNNNNRSNPKIDKSDNVIESQTENTVANSNGANEENGTESCVDPEEEDGTEKIADGTLDIEIIEKDDDSQDQLNNEIQNEIHNNKTNIEISLPPLQASEKTDTVSSTGILEEPSKN